MLKKKKLLTSILIISFLILSVIPAAAEEINIQAPNVPAALPLLWMQEEVELPAVMDLNIKLSSDHQRGISLLAKNDLDFLVTGTNVGANAYNRGIDLKMLNVNTWAIDYLLTDGFKADSWEDLKGKNLVLPLQGGPLDFLARYLAAENGLDPESDLNLVYRALPGAAQLFMSGEFDSIILPEPLATTSLSNRESAELSMDIQKEWAKIHGDERIPFVAFFVSGDFAEENPQFTKMIDGYYQRGVEWVNNNPEAAAELASKHFEMPAEVLQKSYSRVNLNIYSDSESRELIELYFGEMLEMYPDLIGGSLPDEEFYY
ncbi:MAG: ABC transporter substrate-binding protein [Halanaerobium sp.]